MIMKKVTVKVDLENNEGTSYPWWTIVDPHQNMSCDIYLTAGMITGPFFSRESAENFLKRTRYNFSSRAMVFCHSGNYSAEYRLACDKAEKEIEDTSGFGTRRID